MSVKSVVRGARWAGILGGVVLMTGCAAGLDSVDVGLRVRTARELSQRGTPNGSGGSLAEASSANRRV